MREGPGAVRNGFPGERWSAWMVGGLEFLERDRYTLFLSACRFAPATLSPLQPDFSSSSFALNPLHGALQCGSVEQDKTRVRFLN